jgi:hypothetical protein
MRVVASAFALVAFAVTSVAAPAPKPKPGLTKEQELVLKFAEAEMAEAHRLLVRDLVSSRFDPRERQESERKRRGLNVSAAQKLARLDEALSRAAPGQREAVAVKAGRAWLGGGEPEKALPYFDRVIRQSRDPNRRIGAIQGGHESNTRLGRHQEARTMIPLAQAELPRLGKAERAAAEQWISGTLVPT